MDAERRERGEREADADVAAGLGRMEERIGSTYLHYASAAGEGLTLARGVTEEGQQERESAKCVGWRHWRLCGLSRVHKGQNDRLLHCRTADRRRWQFSWARKGIPFRQKFSSAPGLRSEERKHNLGGLSGEFACSLPGDHETWARTDRRFPHAQTPLSPLFAYPTTAAVMGVRQKLSIGHSNIIFTSPHLSNLQLIGRRYSTDCVICHLIKIANYQKLPILDFREAYLLTNIF